MASFLLRNSSRFSTSLSPSSHTLLTSSGNSYKLPSTIRSVFPFPTSCSSSSRSFFTDRCSRCTRFKRDKFKRKGFFPSAKADHRAEMEINIRYKELSSSSSNVQRLISDLLKSLIKLSSRNVTAAAAESGAGSLGGGVAAEATMAAETGGVAAEATMAAETGGVAAEATMAAETGGVAAEATMAAETGGVAAEATMAAETGGAAAWTHASGRGIPARAQKIVGYWFLGCAGACFAQVVLGGVTRLTESGLSMVDWHLIKGMKPPRTQEEWEAYFEKYKQFPEWKYLNEARGLTLEQFKGIFYFEWGHRMLGRAIGVAFLLPLGLFAAKKWIPKQMRGALFGCTALLGFQGGLGWYMVKSGLEDRPDATDIPRVSQYRLASHLGTAFILYAGLLWNGLSLLTQPFHVPKLPITARIRTLAKGNVGLVFITALSGAFVAGLDAGLVWNSYPKMGDNWIPDDVMRFEPKWINIFENTSTVQFDHRLLGHLTFASISALWFMSRKAPLPPRVKTTVNALLGMAIIQVALGVTTILTYVPVPVAASHQAGSLTLLTIATYLVHELKRMPK